MSARKPKAKPRAKRRPPLRCVYCGKLKRRGEPGIVCANTDTGVRAAAHMGCAMAAAPKDALLTLLDRIKQPGAGS